MKYKVDQKTTLKTPPLLALMRGSFQNVTVNIVFLTESVSFIQLAPSGAEYARQ